MKFIFNPFFIKNNELLFYTYLGIIILIIIITILFVIKEVGKK